MAAETRAVKLKPIPVDGSDMNIDGMLIHPQTEPCHICGGDHSHILHGIPDDHGRMGYFRSHSNDVWQGHSRVGVFPFKSTIRDGNLTGREVIASNIAKALNVDGVPTTKWIRIRHGVKDYGKGTIHMSPVDLLTQKGYTHNQGSFHEWRSENLRELEEHVRNNRSQFEQLLANDPRNVDFVDTHGRRIKEALRNGGMDLAYFDYIVGHANRHNHDYVAGTMPESDTSKLIAHVHGLCFPGSPHLFYPDYIDSLNGLWKQVDVHGKDIAVSDEFKKSVDDPATSEKIKSILSNSNLKQSEQSGALQRLAKITEQCKRGLLRGTVLMRMISESIHGNKSRIIRKQ